MPSFQQFDDKTASQYFTTGQEVELITILVPMGQVFVLSHFANEVNDSRAWGTMKWKVFIDGVPARNYDNIQDQIGTFNLPREIPFGFVSATREVRVYIEHTGVNNGTPDTNTYKAGVSIKGAYLKND